VSGALCLFFFIIEVSFRVSILLQWAPILVVVVGFFVVFLGVVFLGFFVVFFGVVFFGFFVVFFGVVFFGFFVVFFGVVFLGFFVVFFGVVFLGFFVVLGFSVVWPSTKHILLSPRSKVNNFFDWHLSPIQTKPPPTVTRPFVIVSLPLVITK